LKPDNILVGKDGRVRVVDFGLARRSDFKLESLAERSHLNAANASQVSGLFDVSHTMVGSLVGTPAYMPPEQLDSGEIDARSDIFSFCVSLFEALYGQRPFTGDDADELRQAIVAGDMAELPRDAIVPARVHKVVLRGLAADRKDRPPSMAELLAGLRTAIDRPRRIWFAALGALSVVSLAVGLIGAAALQRSASAELCTGAPARLIGVWDPPARAALEHAVLASGLSYAPATWVRLAARLDRYTEAWTAMHGEACLTHHRGEQSDELFERRMTCLDDRLAEVAAVIDVLKTADRTAIERAVQATEAISTLDRCVDSSLLMAQTPPPTPTVAAAAADLRERVARAKAEESAGRYPAALAQIDAVVTDAQALAYPPVIAMALHRRASVQERMGEYVAAEASGFAALAAAETAGDDGLRARIGTALIQLTGPRMKHFDEALHLSAQIGGLLARVDQDPEVRIQFLGSTGNVHFARGALPEARATLAEALALAERSFGPDDPRLVPSLSGLGNVAVTEGRPAEALAFYRRGLAIWETSLGPEHPRLVALLTNIVASANADPASRPLAVESAYRAVALAERALGPEHPETLATLSSLGQTLIWQDKPGAAEPVLRRLMAARERALGPDHPDVIGDVYDLTLALARQGRLTEAFQLGDRLYSAWQRTAERPPAFDTLAALMVELGDAARSAGAPPEARKFFGIAVEIGRVTTPGDPQLATALWKLAVVILDAELATPNMANVTNVPNMTNALSALQEALAIARAKTDTIEPEIHAAIEFDLARALWFTDPREAMTHAIAARTAFVGLGEAGRAELGRVDAWLATHTPGR
ncbi:MAG TPA: tetratricopeptide repeat protein, partial [Nannocystis sp.]